jgi:hypothetical protein
LCRAVDLLPKVSSKWLSSNQISSSSPPLNAFISKINSTYQKSKHNMLLHYFQTTLQKKALISLIVFWYDIATNVFKEYPKSILQLIYFIGNYNKQKSTCNFLLQSFSWSFELRIIVLSNERQVFNNSNWYRNN